MVDLFQTTKQNISLHVKIFFEEGELEKDSTVKKYLTVQKEGPRNVSRELEHYNLDVIISVGYRVKSLRGTRFRIWATQTLKEYMIKGFALNDDLLKQSGWGGYWKELLERIRDIRSSEKILYRQILDIYATSINYTQKQKKQLNSLKLFKIKCTLLHMDIPLHKLFIYVPITQNQIWD